MEKEKEVLLEIDKHNSNHRLFNNCKDNQKKQEKGKENWRKKKKKKRINLRQIHFFISKTMIVFVDNKTGIRFALFHQLK